LPKPLRYLGRSGCFGTLSTLPISPHQTRRRGPPVPRAHTGRGHVRDRRGQGQVRASLHRRGCRWGWSSSRSNSSRVRRRISISSGSFPTGPAIVHHSTTPVTASSIDDDIRKYALTLRQPPPARQLDVQDIPLAQGLMRGSTAIVTGGGSGLGRGIASGLAACGAAVVASGRRREILDDAVAEITALGGTAAAVACDIRDPEAVATMVAEAEAALGPVNILVNNAGATFTAPAETLSPNAFRAVVETDAFGTFYACQEVGRRWIERGTGGAILNITSTSPMTGNPGRQLGDPRRADLRGGSGSAWGCRAAWSSRDGAGHRLAGGVPRAPGGGLRQRSRAGRRRRQVAVLGPHVCGLGRPARVGSGAQLVIRTSGKPRKLRRQPIGDRSAMSSGWPGGSVRSASRCRTGGPSTAL
jgi:NAD(P)-dependent dehydrogenase (short-subunit alcohol dehydrogenase family)